MAGEKWGEILQFVRQLGGPGQGTGASDGQLLEQFVQRHDESAFELLLWRHGAMVWNVCRRLLPHEQDAEDAFQATFLALVRKARAIRRGQALAAWLYRVAWRVALEARTQSAHVAGHEKLVQAPETAAPAEPPWDDLRPVLDEEVNRLPERLRLPLILCYFQGKTNQEAAQQLGCPVGTVFSRLAKGRELLRSRLLRRGLALSAGGLTALFAQNAAAAGPCPALVAATLRAGLLSSAGKAGAVSTRVATLTEGVLKAMFLKQLKTTVSLVLLLMLLAAGGGGLIYRALADDPPDQARVEPPHAAQGLSRKEPERTIMQPGTLVPLASVDIFTRVPGFVKKMNVDIGDRVKRGEVVAVIDAPELERDLQQATIAVDLAWAKLEQQKALVGNAEAELRAAGFTIAAREAELTSAKSNLSFREKQYKRMETLVATKSIDERLLEEQLERLQSAKAQVEAARAALEIAKGDRVTKQTKVQLAEVAVKIERLQLESTEVGLRKAEYLVNATRLTAPFDGVVAARRLNTGDLVSPQKPVPLLRIVRTDVLRLIVQVPERDALLVRPGTPVTYQLSGTGEKLTGLTVSRVGPVLDENVRTLRVEVDVPNARGTLRAGMYGNAELKVSEPSRTP